MNCESIIFKIKEVDWQILPIIFFFKLKKVSCVKLVANCKDDVYLIKMVNFKVVVLFIKMLTCFLSHRTFGNVIYDIVQKYSQLSTSKLRKLEKLSIKLKKADLDITFLSNCKVFNVIPKFLTLFVIFAELFIA